MTIEQIYDKYNLLPNLREHHYRVAAVAVLICEHWEGEAIDVKLIKRVCLVHDLGNIIKADFDKYSHLLGKEEANVDYWKKVRQEFIEKYGSDEDAATYSIAFKIGISEKELKLLKGLGFSNLEKILEKSLWEPKICIYADMRVGPFGVVSLTERYEEGRKRYQNTNKVFDAEKRDKLMSACFKIEALLQENTGIDIYHIDDQLIDSYISDLHQEPF